MSRNSDALRAYNDRLAHDLLDATQISLWEALRRTADLHPERPALVTPERSLSYAELAARVLRCAARLREMGVGRGTRVSLIFHNSIEWAVLHYALMRLGALAVPINLAYERDELRFVLERGRSELLIAVEQFRGADLAARLRTLDDDLRDGATRVESLPRLRRVVTLPIDGEDVARDSRGYRELYGSDGDPQLDVRSAVGGRDPAYILFTSGSTAFPKPVLLTNGGYVGAATMLCHAIDLQPTDRYLAFNTTFHTSGIVWNLGMTHLRGAAAHVLPYFEPRRALAEIERGRITLLGSFDVMFSKMMAAPEFANADKSSIVKSLPGATPSFLRNLYAQWDLGRFANIYGSTESHGLATITPAAQDDDDARFDANGMAPPGVEIAILDPESGRRCAPDEPGEICFRGWCRFVEYVGMPEETEKSVDAEGFFHSGDYGWLDAAGNLYFRGRYKMMVKTGGENVAEREVEIFLENVLEGCVHAEVVGAPHDVWGQVVAAFVEFSDERPRSSGALRETCKGRIAGFKIPRYFFPVERGSWPQLGSGRTDKHVLRARAAELVAEAQRAEAPGAPG